jgi:rhamnosyl/mannosyltransferase
MEILHIGKYFPPEPGGVEAVVKSFTDATEGKLGNYCIVASKKGPSRVESSGGTTIHFLKERGTFLLAPILPSLPFVLHRLRRASRFPAIMVHYPNPTAMLALFLSLVIRPKREKIIVWCHADVIFKEWWKRVLYFLYQPVEDFVFRRTNAFVGATPHHVREYSTLSGKEGRTYIIPYAIPDDWFEISAGEEETVRMVKDQVGGDFLLFVGRLVPYKGLETLLRAAEKIPCRIALIGTGPLEETLRKEIRRGGLDARVLLLGKVENVRPYFLGCEFLVLPSNSALEGFGIVQIEAMALGKPVVSSDLPTGVTYVNRDGETGITFPVGDSDAFAAACNRLLEDGTLRSRLGAYAKTRTQEKFSYSAMADQAVSFFWDLCGKGPV